MLKEAQMHQNKYPKADFRGEIYEVVYKLFLSWDWSVSGDGVDRLSLPYSVLGINLLVFAVAVQVAIQEREHKLNKIYSDSCLAVQER